MHNNTLLRARRIKEIVDANYEPGRHDRCKLWIYRNIINKKYPISISTFFRYLNIAEGNNNPKQLLDDPNQLKLFDF